MQKPETLARVYIHTPYIYKNVYKLIRKVQKNNLINKVVLVSVSEKRIRLKRKIDKDSICCHRARDETSFMKKYAIFLCEKKIYR